MSNNPFDQGIYRVTPPTLSDGDVCALQLDVNGNLKVTFTSSGPQEVTGTFWQDVQPISGTISVHNFPTTFALTGTFWQATQPVSGTFWQATQPVSGTVSVSNFPATQPVSGTVAVSNFPSTLAVTGTFWPATQPVSIAAPVVLAAGTAIIGKVGIDQTTPGTTNKVSIGTDGVTSTKIALTASAPANNTAGISSASAVAANANRKGLVIVNTSLTAWVYLGLGATAVVGSGVALGPGGGSFTMDEYSFTTAAVNAIASAASTNLAIQEFTT